MLGSGCTFRCAASPPSPCLWQAAVRRGRTCSAAQAAFKRSPPICAHRRPSSRGAASWWQVCRPQCRRFFGSVQPDATANPAAALMAALVGQASLVRRFVHAPERRSTSSADFRAPHRALLLPRRRSSSTTRRATSTAKRRPAHGRLLICQVAGARGVREGCWLTRGKALMEVGVSTDEGVAGERRMPDMPGPIRAMLEGRNFLLSPDLL